MNDIEFLMSETQSIFNMLDADEYPEAHNYLAHILSEDDEIEESPYEIASVLINCDKPQDFPDFLITYITELLEMDIAKGNDIAMNDLGALYYDGKRGFEQSFEKAVHYYEMAASKGNLLSQENLGYCWYYGRTGKKDYQKAFQYFAMGAFCGSLPSLYKIGDMYLNGYYVPKDDHEAFNVYMHCLDMMTDEAAPQVAGPIYLRLGKMFLNGLGTEQKLKTALVCYQKAEAFLYDMIENGDYMFKKSWQAAIDGQAKARTALTTALSDKEWEFD